LQECRKPSPAKAAEGILRELHAFLPEGFGKVLRIFDESRETDRKLENQDRKRKKTSRITVSTAVKAIAVKCRDFSVLQKIAQQTGGNMKPPNAARTAHHRGA
jgi:hypothetical protein